MRIKVVLFSIIFSLSSFADNTDISPQMFSNQILPSLKKLVEDYYELLAKLDPINKEVIQLKENISVQISQWQSFTDFCLKDEEKCKEKFPTIKNDFLKENQLVLKIENDFKLTPGTGKKLTDSRVLLSNTINSVSDDSHKILSSLNLFKFRRKDFFEITDLLKDLKLNLNILTTGFLDEDYQDNFYFIYSNFFKMLENDIIEKSNLSLFNREVANLNISWNTFNMKVPKWKASLPADTINQIESMHKRWNSILKLIWGKG